MARCKAGHFATEMLNPLSPNTHYEAYAGGAAAIPKTEIVVTPPIAGKMSRRCCCTYCFVGILAIILCTFVIIEIFPYPLRASCIVKWGFNTPCTFVMQRLRYQILKWTSCNDCGHRGNRCLYSAKSVSRAWFMMFDYGTNYCNLRNLVDDAGLEADRGFIELTNDGVCTQFNTAVCI